MQHYELIIKKGVFLFVADQMIRTHSCLASGTFIIIIIIIVVNL